MLYEGHEKEDRNAYILFRRRGYHLTEPNRAWNFLVDGLRSQLLVSVKREKNKMRFGEERRKIDETQIRHASHSFSSDDDVIEVL